MAPVKCPHGYLISHLTLTGKGGPALLKPLLRELAHCSLCPRQQSQSSEHTPSKFGVSSTVAAGTWMCGLCRRETGSKHSYTLRDLTQPEEKTYRTDHGKGRGIME